MGGKEENGVTPTNQKKEELKFPRSIGFIVSNEFCERFSYYGLRTVLVFYLRDKISYDDDTATVVFHAFTLFVYLFPLFGAMVADSWLGKFKTILYLSIVYAIGNAVITLGSIPDLNFPMEAMTIFGLFLVAMGSGGIKPCVSAFGGDQFILPQQAKQLALFFSLFYFAINSGSFLSTFIMPILRLDVKCFGDDDCYALAFGVPGALMVVAIFIFVFGKKLYLTKEPEGNVVWKLCKCIGNAISQRSELKDIAPRKHWLDYAEGKYDAKFISDVKAALRVLVLYLPLPVFWALFDQQGSRWTFQASRMDGQVGPYVIKPDQMQVVNSLFILLFIPLFETVIYPMLAKCKISRPLQKLTIGGILAGVAFLISGIVELELEKTYPVLPSAGEGQFRIFNGFDCDLTISTNSPQVQQFDLKALGYYENKHLEVSKTKLININIASENCPNLFELSDKIPLRDTIILREEKSVSYFLTIRNGSVYLKEYLDDVDKSRTGNPNVRVLSNTHVFSNISILDVFDGKVRFSTNTSSINMDSVLPATYQVLVGNTKVGEPQKLDLGGVFTFLLTEKDDRSYEMNRITIAEPNSLHMLWLIPQYVVITMGEVMFSVTGLEFSFSQAPVSMKSVLQSFWLLTVCFGNIIVIIVAEAKAFDKQSSEFFLFACLMFVDMGIFMLMAMRYKYVKQASDDPVNKPSDIALQTTIIAANGLDNPTFKIEE